MSETNANVGLTAQARRSRRSVALRTRPDWLAHSVLILGVLLFALPVWLVFAGSTQDPDAINRGELSLLPDPSGFGVYGRVLSQGAFGAQAVWHMLMISAG